MPAHTTAELHPTQSAERTERYDAEQHLRIMIETMVREGHTEREITQAVQRASARL